MADDPTRRSRLTGIAMQEKTWDLENLKVRQRAAAERFESAATAADELAEEIDTTQGQLSSAMNGDCALDLHAIQATRAYLGERSELLKRYVADLRGAAEQASQADIEVRHAALTVRALGRVKTRSDNEVRKILETRLQELDIELWMQSTLGGDKND